MLVTLLGMVMEAREEQYEKAEFPMLVTLLGMVTEVREEQPLKTLIPILSMVLSGSIIPVRDVQFKKAQSAINRVSFFTVYMPEIVYFALIRQLLIYKTSFSQLDSSLYMPVLEKVVQLNSLMDLGILIDVREEQSLKAPPPRLVTPSGISIAVKEVHFSKV